MSKNKKQNFENKISNVNNFKSKKIYKKISEFIIIYGFSLLQFLVDKDIGYIYNKELKNNLFKDI